MGREAKKIHDVDMQDFARRSETKYQLEAMIGIAQTLAGMSVMPDNLDSNPYLLNCKNGVIDLKNGTLMPHDKCLGLLLTKMAPVNYRADAQCPQWLKFLDRIFKNDLALIAYVQKVIGYGLTGAVTEKALFLFHGDGNNGKTTLLETIRQMLGDYAGVVGIDSLMSTSQDSARERAIANLHRKRFVTASEAEAGQRFKEGTIKNLTGMGRLLGRHLYSNSFEFDPEFKLFIDANHKPDIRGTDEAIWVRVRLIPFTVTIPDADIDKDLWRKLRAELPGILAWAVQGCLRWQKEGIGTPEAVRTASEAYREEMDIVATFLADRCEKDADSSEGATKLYQAFIGWCLENGEKPIAQNVFGNRLKKYGYTSDRNAVGNHWRGLKLRLPEPVPTQPAATGRDPFRYQHLSKVSLEPEPVM
jgi:putative DNA primase/helicase